MNITKRDYSVQPYSRLKISNAILAAFFSVDENLHHTELDALINLIEESVFAEANGDISIDIIQAHVELSLLKEGYTLPARAYIAYRASKDVKRDAKRDRTPLENYLATVTNDLPIVALDKVIADIKLLWNEPVDSVENLNNILLGINPFIELDEEYDRFAVRILLTKINREVTKTLGLETYTPNSLLRTMLEYGIKEGIYGQEAQSYIDSQCDYTLLMENNSLFSYMGLTALYGNYLSKDRSGNVFETPQAFWMRVAMGIHSNEKGHMKNVINCYSALSSMDYVHSTPTLFNSLLSHSQTASCYLLTPDDSIEGIFDMFKQNAKLSKFAGGLGNDWTPVRALGSKIKGTNGESQGIIPFLKMNSDLAVAVNQSGRRLGSIATYLEPWHADFLDFLTIKKETGDHRRLCHDLNTAAWIPDLFMDRVKEEGTWCLFSPDETPELHGLVGDAFKEKYEEYEKKGRAGELHVFTEMEAVHLWRLTLVSLYETSGPWLCWKDPSNERYANQHKGVVNSSNLCVAPETKILTENGYVEIHQLEGILEPCWNGFEWSPTQIEKTANNAPLFKVKTSNGHSLRCTAEHEWEIYDKETLKLKVVPTSELRPDDELIVLYTDKIKSTKPDMENAYQDGYDNIGCPSVTEYSTESCVQWFAGYCGANLINKDVVDGLISTIVLPLETTDAEVLLLMQELGIRHTIEDEYFGKEWDNITIGSISLHMLIDLGLVIKDMVIIPIMTGQASHVNKIVSVEADGEGPTYCGHELKVNRLTFNGILTRNCTEITLHTSTEETAVCMLATISVPKHINEKGEIDLRKLSNTVDVAVRALDKLIEYNYYPTKQSRRSNEKNRPLGLGLIGLQDAYYKCKLSYSSEQAVTLASDFAQAMSFYAISTSVELAKENGAYENYEGSLWDQGILPHDAYNTFKKKRSFKFPVLEKHDWDSLRERLAKYGIRNGTLLSQPPTATVSLLTNQSQSSEPMYQNLYYKSNIAGDFMITNKYLINELKELGLWGMKTMMDLKRYGGTLSKIDYIPNEIKERYQVAFEVDTFFLLKNAAMRQIWFCQALSTNLYVTNATGRKLNDMYMMAYDMGLKTTYYLRAMRQTVEDENVTPNIEDGCEMCQ